ncbi:Aerotolerance-Related Exported Protein [Bacteroidales bacterium CF]|nr:Aerotolerance-Related Exported Protein [Bacteroidales bacterium CF]
MDVPRVVGSDENFRLVFIAEGEPSSFNPPQLKDFDVLAGPSTSTMTSTQIINGKRTDSYQVSYTYILQARSVGTFSIPSASAVIGGKTYHTNPVSVEVVKGDANNSGNSSGATSQKSSGTISSDDIFMKMSVSKGKVVKGESLLATLKLYTKVPIGGFENVKFPTFNGFWSQEVDTPSNIEFTRETVNGKIYNAAVLRRYMLIPQQTGNLVIDPSEMTCLVQVRASSGGSRSMFDDFFDSYQTIKRKITAPSIHVNVSPLPSGAPASFAGGVGEFQLSARLTKDTINANEAVSLEVSVSGSGNLNLVEAPKITFPADFEVYDTKINDNTSKSGRGTSGTKVFEYPLIPRGAGVFELGPVVFSYFDIGAKKYKTLTSEKLTLRVGQAVEGSENSSASLPMGVNKQSVKSIGSDVRYIRSGLSGLVRGNSFFFGSVTFFALIVLIAASYILMDKFLSKRIERNRDIAGVKNRRANKVARARLKNAESLMKQNLYSAFFEELHRAILGYCSDKLNLSLADLSREKIASSLEEKSVSKEHSEELLALIEVCEYARYAPDQDKPEMGQNYQRAIKLISDLEV